MDEYSEKLKTAFKSPPLPSFQETMLRFPPGKFVTELSFKSPMKCFGMEMPSPPPWQFSEYASKYPDPVVPYFQVECSRKAAQLARLEAHIKADCRPFCSQTARLGGGGAEQGPGGSHRSGHQGCESPCLVARTRKFG